jgi:predicted AAA+ superfamily ATPase
MTTPYTPRIVDEVLARRVRHHPAILIVGPRATGKTTAAGRLARTVIRLDQPAQAAVVSADPDAALRGLEEPVLIDEWQIAPDVLGAVPPLRHSAAAVPPAPGARAP